MSDPKAKHPINPELGEFYQYLEDLRSSGVCNMHGAAQYLLNDYDLSKDEAKGILLSWKENYKELLQTGLIVKRDQRLFAYEG